MFCVVFGDSGGPGRLCKSFILFDDFLDMSFILVPEIGEELQVNAWNWRPTLELLLAEGVISEEDYDLLGVQGCGGRVNIEKAEQIADAVGKKVMSMNSEERLRSDLSITNEPKKLAVFSPDMTAGELDANELYSTTTDWLAKFERFCRRSGGFKVV